MGYVVIRVTRPYSWAGYPSKVHRRKDAIQWSRRCAQSRRVRLRCVSHDLVTVIEAVHYVEKVHRGRAVPVPLFPKIVPWRRVIGAASVTIIPLYSGFQHLSVGLGQLVELPVQLRKRIVIRVVKIDDGTGSVVGREPISIDVGRFRPKVD